MILIWRRKTHEGICVQHKFAFSPHLLWTTASVFDAFLFITFLFLALLCADCHGDGKIAPFCVRLFVLLLHIWLTILKQLSRSTHIHAFISSLCFFFRFFVIFGPDSDAQVWTRNVLYSHESRTTSCKLHLETRGGWKNNFTHLQQMEVRRKGKVVHYFYSSISPPV